MKKRLLSLLLAVVLCIGLLPVGALAADGNVTIKVDGVDKETGDIKKSGGVEQTGPALTSSDTNLSNKFYIVKDNVTINGDLTIDGSQQGGLVLCADATLTVTGALIYSGGSWFSIYGQTQPGNSQSTGKLIIENSNGDGAAIRSTASSAPSLNISSGKVEIYGGKSEKLINGVYLTSTSSVHKVTLDGETASPTAWQDQSSLSGSTLVLEYCEHIDADTVWIKDDDTQHHWACSVCGFVSSAKEQHTVVFPVAWTETTHTLRCEYCDYTADPAKHDFTKLQSPEVSSDGKGHVSKSCVCGYTSEEPEAHTYIKNTNGSCDKCGFMPFMSDSEGNLYDKNSYQEAFEKAAAGEVEWLQLENKVTDPNSMGVWTKSIEFSYSGKPVTLKMNNVTLSSTDEAALTVNGGSLIIEDAAVLDGENGGAGNPATSAIKVTGGNLTFNSTVNATGGAKNSGAAPAIEVTGGTVAFEQAVTATAVENAGTDTAIAPAIEVTGGKVIFHGKVTATGGLGGVTGNKMSCESAVYANDGELDFNGDLDLNGGLTITGDARLTKGLTRGTFKVDYTGETVDGDRVSVVGSANYKNLNSLLAADRAFVSEDETRKYPCVGDNNRSWGGDVTIQEHTHVYNPAENYTCECGVTCDHSAGYENGRCKTCKMPCPHRRLGIGDRDCLDCGQRMYVVRQTKNSSGNTLWFYYTDLPTALAAAEDGDTVTLLDNIDQSYKTACLTGDGKTVTLNLNGKNITGGWIDVGSDQDGTVINSSRLNITGSGSFDGMIIISAKGTLDLSGWDGGTIRTVSSSQNGSDESKLISGENKGTITSLQFYNWPSDKISKTKLTGGTYGSIPISMNNGVTSISFSDLLAPGYAFQYTDGSGFLPYDTKALYENSTTTISNVKVVRCTSHVDANSDNHCDYCNTDLTANTVATLMVDGATYYYTDLPSAVAKANTTGGTIQLRQDVTGLTEKLDINHSKGFAITLDLNGHTISGTVKTGNTLLAVSTFGTVTIDDTSSAKTGKIVGGNGGGYAVYVSDGKLIITGGTFEGTDVAEMEGLPGQAGYALGADGSELVTINGGTFNSAVDAKDKLTVNDGIFKKAVTISARGATITGGTFNGAFSMSAQPDVFSGGTFTQQAVFSSVSNILTGGEFQKGIKSTDKKLYELLAENKAYQTADDWLDDNTTYFYNDTGSSVTVAEAPIHSVTLTVNGTSVELDEDNKGRFSVELGTAVTLTASCEGSMEAPYGTWYPTLGGEEDGSTGSPVKQDTGKSLSYTLPPEDLTVGTHTYRVSFCSKNPGKVGLVTGYYKGAQITITVTPRDLKNATVEYYTTDNPTVVTYNPLNNHICELPIYEVTLDGVKLEKGTDYIISGNTAAEVGKYTAILTAKSDSTKCKGTLKIEWEIVPYALPEPSFEGNQMYTKIYDGSTNLPKEYKFQALFLAKEPGSSLVDWKEDENNYEVTAAEFVSPDAGENKPINQTITLKNKNFVFAPTINIVGVTTTDNTITYKNFTLSEAYPTLGTTFNIKKATVPDFDKEVTLDIINDLENTYTIDLPALPALESPKTYGDITYTVASQSLEHGYATLGQPTVKQVDGKYQLCLTVPAVKYDQETSIGTILVKVTTTNYNDVVLTVNLQAVNKRKLGVFVSVATDPVVYGMTLGDIKLSAQATDGGQVIHGTIAWEDPLTTVPAAGQATYRWTFTPDDTMQYLTASNTISFSVDKATPTGAPTYTAITASGKKLSDAGLAANESWPVGTLQWVDKDGKALDAAATEVKANTAYQWKFTPDSKNYNPIEGSITLYSVSTGGGGSTTYPVSTPSKTENGSVSVSPKNASRGDTVTITVKPDDGYVLDDLTVTDKNGNDLKLTDKGNGKYTFTMPAGKVEVKASFAEEAETSPFADVATDAYYYEAVKWAAEQGITGGIGNNLFGPNYPCTRAQIVTFLWRAAGSPEPKDMSSFVDVSTGSYYAKAVAWAVENGITTGTGNGKFSPDATCTRAQAVTFLARALNAKATSAAEFSDVPTDSYFAEAVAWAASNGVTAGIGGGLFGPNNDCTRAQIVTFLFRAYNK